jgi:NAD+ synthase (glutamine-hydrolysing)
MKPLHPYIARQLRLALVQMRVYPGEPRRNVDRALSLLAETDKLGADLAVFPEMCLPGYLLGDMWERPSFLVECEQQAERLIAATKQTQCAILFGTVGVDKTNSGEDGRPRKFNAFVFARKGEAWLHPGLQLPFGVKTLQPNYREFDDTRHFCDARRLAQELACDLNSLTVPIEARLGLGHFHLGAHLCEDAWQADYAAKPIDLLATAGADILINLSASPFTRGKNGKRNRVFGALASRLNLPLVYVNAVSLQNNAKTLYTFDGRSTLYDCDGKGILELPSFEESIGLATLTWNSEGKVDVTETQAVPGLDSTRAPLAPLTDTVHGIAEVHAALRFGLQEFLTQIGLQRVVIGLSGGIDSAVSAALFREVLPPESILLVNMPSRFNSETTKGLAETLARNLNCPYLVLPIDDSVALTQLQIEGAVVQVPPGNSEITLQLQGLALENVQARDRGARLLAAVAAAFGGVFVCNTNKTEMTVGYGTLYGDIAGFLAPLADLWKGDVYALGRFLNETVYGKEMIPQGIFNVTPSAELSAAQAVDEGKGDPLIYPYHDRLFFAFVQRWNRATPEEVLTWYLAGSLDREIGLEGATQLFPNAASFIDDLEKWWNLYGGLGVVKRLQAPPVLAISSRAFGFDHRESLLPIFYSSRYQDLKRQALGLT